MASDQYGDVGDGGRGVRAYHDELDHQDRRDIRQRMREVERQQEDAVREEKRKEGIRESTKKCIECKHFFYGTYRLFGDYVEGGRYASRTNPYNPYNNIKMHGRRTAGEIEITFDNDYMWGLCRRNPEPIEKPIAHTCGECERDATRVDELVSRYGQEDVDDMFIELFPERDWLSPNTSPSEADEEVVDVLGMDEELFEVT